jgi:hypothetical protein
MKMKKMSSLGILLVRLGEKVGNFFQRKENEGKIRPALETFCNSIDLPTDSKYNANACSTTICALNTETIELIME